MAKVSIDIKSGSIGEKEPVVGIDLGTTNSLVAIIDSQTGKAKALRGKSESVMVPSLLHFGKNGEIIVGHNARPFLAENPERTVYSVKRLMGKSYADVEDHPLAYEVLNEQDDSLVKVKIDQRFYTPIELSSLILKELKMRASQELGKEVKKAVITVPAYFNDVQRQATRDAGKLAGLDVLRIVNEPTAASLAYGIGIDPNETKHVAVYDLGGGTFDISVLRIEQGIFEVLSTHGDTYLGGDDIDLAVARFWQEKYALGNPENAGEWQTLRLLAEEAKQELSKAAASSKLIRWKNQDRELSLSADELKTCATVLLDKTLHSCELALKDSGLRMDELSEVVLVGGSTRMPLVRETVAGFFKNIPVNHSLNPDEVVALGAAVEADILAGNRKDILLLDVTPLSLGIETLGGLMDTLLPRNSKIPARVAKSYTTSVDGQVNLKINVYQGERELVSENRKLAEFVLKGIPAMPAGFPKIQVGFMLDADGILKVEALEERSGVKQHIEVKPQYGLSDDQVEKMLLDSITHAASDVQTRMLLEARTEAQQLIYVTERFLEKNDSLLSDEELQRSALLVNDLRNSLESSDKDAILGMIDELNEYTRPFAERLMDLSISKALKGKNIEL